MLIRDESLARVSAYKAWPLPMRPGRLPMATGPLPFRPGPLDGALAKLAALAFGEATPDAEALVILQRILKAFVAHLA